MYNLFRPSEQMSGSNKIIVNSKNNISGEQLEISVKTFFGHEIKVKSGGSYEVLTGGIKGLIDKIIWFFFAPTLESRKAVVKESLKNNINSTNEKTESNNGDEKDSPKTITTSDDLNKTNQSLSEKNTKMVNNSYDSNFQLLSNKKDSIGNQTNINNDNRNNSSTKERESGNIDNKFSIFNNKDKINFVDGQNSARTDVNNMCHNSSILSKEEFADNDFSIFNDENNAINSDGENQNLAKNDVNNMGHDSSVLSKEEFADNDFSIFNDENNAINSDGENQNLARTDVNNMGHDNFDLSEQELKDLDKEIKDLRLQENEVQFYKESRIAEIKKNKKEKTEEQKHLENIIKQSESENENIEKKYKEAESNLKKMMPEGYRVTSFDKRDGIIGDGNCFYRAIAKLENGNQEEYGKIRTTISDEINKSAGLAEKSADKIDNNLLTLIQLYAWEYNELKDVEEVNENNLSGVLYQIKEHVKGEDKKNEYAGPIEAYFYAKAAKKTVILYDSSNQVHVFIPDKKGDSVHVEHVDPDKIENHIKENKIDIANAVKLAYNATGKHYEAIVPVYVKN